MEVSSWENHLFRWAIYTMAMLVITRGEALPWDIAPMMRPLCYLCWCATPLSVPLQCPQKQQNNVLFVQWRYQHVAVFFGACWCYGTGAPERFFTSWTLWFKELPWDIKASLRAKCKPQTLHSRLQFSSAAIWEFGFAVVFTVERIYY